MNLIDEQFTKTPFYGVPRMTAWLNVQGQEVNHKRVRRLMRLMGLEAIYPKPRLSCSNQEHKKYPYLLNNMVIDHPDQVWCADITYIRMLHGFVYLVAIMDWYSRFVLAWEISTTLDTTFCLAALEQALETLKTGNFQYRSGQSVYQPGVYRSPGTKRLSGSAWMAGDEYSIIFLSRGSGDPLNTRKSIFTSTKRFPRRVTRLTEYFLFYNMERLHESLGYQPPYQVYVKERLTFNPVQASTMHQIQPYFLS